MIMNHKKIAIVVFIALVLTGTGILWWKIKNVSQSEKIAEKIERQSAKDDEIESVKDLIDGEYVFAPIDTSDWQTYRNEEAGFEMKIPKNWKLVNTYKDSEIKGEYLYFGKEGTTYPISEGGESGAAILVMSSDRFNKKAMPIREFLQKRKSGYGENLSSLSVDNTKAIVLGEKSVYFFNSDKAWTISFQLYYDPNNNIHVDEHTIFLGMTKTFKFLE